MRDYLLQYFLGCNEERFVSLWLDAWHRILAVDELFRGTLTESRVYPRLIVKVAIARNAQAMSLAHNHPSGCWRRHFQSHLWIEKYWRTAIPQKGGNEFWTDGT